MQKVSKKYAKSMQIVCKKYTSLDKIQYQIYNNHLITRAPLVLANHSLEDHGRSPFISSKLLKPGGLLSPFNYFLILFSLFDNSADYICLQQLECCLL